MSRARAHFYQAFRGLPLTRQCSIQTERVSRSARASEKKMNDAFDRRQRQCSVGLLQAQNPSKARGWAQAPLRSPLRGAQGAICAPGVGRSGPYSGPRHAPTQRHGAPTVHTHNRSAASRFNKKHNRVRGQASLVPQSVRFDPRSTRAALASAAADTSSVEWQQMARTALSVLLSGLSISPVSPLSPLSHFTLSHSSSGINGTSYRVRYESLEWRRRQLVYRAASLLRLLRVSSASPSSPPSPPASLSPPSPRSDASRCRQPPWRSSR